MKTGVMLPQAKELPEAGERPGLHTLPSTGSGKPCTVDFQLPEPRSSVSVVPAAQCGPWLQQPEETDGWDPGFYRPGQLVGCCQYLLPSL